MTPASPPTHPYLHGHHDSVLRSHRWRTAENSIGYLIPSLHDGDQVLDVGCGPGTITVGLARYVGRARVLGIDPAEGVLADARAEAARQGRATSPSRSVTCTISASTTRHSTSCTHTRCSNTCLIPWRRWSRWAGCVAPVASSRRAMGDYGGMHWFPEDPELEEWRTLYQRVARTVGGEPDAGRRLFHWARRAGFADVQASASSWCYAGSDERSWWGGLWAERLTRSGFAVQATSHGLATHEDLERLAGAWRRWASSEDGWFVVPNAEVLCHR